MSDIGDYNEKKDILEARDILWYRGNIEWKLDPTQKRMYKLWKENSEKITVINISRRVGKSYFLTILAIQQCIKQPKSIVKFLQPEQKMVRTNLRPIMEEILDDCPTKLRPQFKTQDNIYKFPNGSEIQLAGTDGGNAEKIRGGNADLCLIDEAAFVKSELRYLVNSVLIPTTMLTRGKIILSSTSPKEATHDFAKYMETAEIKGTLIRSTIFDALDDNEGLENPRFTEEIVNEIIEAYPSGIADDEFRREYMCEILQNGDNSVIPEFTNELEAEIVKEWPKPTFCDKYVSMDIGFRDLTVVLFAYYDFENAVAVIEDELTMNGKKMTTKRLAEDIILKERHLWTDKLTLEVQKPYMRVSDNNLIVINDLQRLHGITFLPTQKDNKESAVNNTRIMIGGYQVYINPRCTTLISHLKHATWSKSRDKFTRSPDMGHYDAVDALVYLLRNIDKNKNPFPKGYAHSHLNAGDGKFLNPYYDDTTSSNSVFKKMFNVKKKI